MIQLGEDWGIGEEDFKVAQELRLRTSNRTNSYCNEELTTRINPRLPEQLLDFVEASSPYTSVRGIHPNWRVARYQAVLKFLQVKRSEGGGDFCGNLEGRFGLCFYHFPGSNYC